MEFKISTIEEWQEVIQQILPQLKHPILLLKGNLGVGKTSFTQFLLRTLGSTDEVSSPTYAIVNEYTCPKGNIYHFDLYRMKSIDEAFDIGIEEYLETGFLSIIEWPEIYETELEGLHYHEMKIENIDGERHIVFK
ncbi:tRNA (adenosine(37)-N6)-threonylcarbamoyltransferase complex ATPase subunit type 1 TsaE [Riemerella anatipestifer]|uniref:tRNA threonylcarbamoyladenosine biosynthesis protein TsaE n=2 Tax=Riemerella anatipestifer TaxID=34085 RepID=A0AAP6HGG8_RIEAN|nr:tRNA (adenosine(37)-N6)-threonylcarbamoyltransferase complex ATPase subunit type 1 TsaE [Riemerella anatipestifer]MBT0534492.1 tRNA (adenosine(37)-N6)-threonylcarbamoyltransferase complex ATPase subunit type 1 TsaE [Riemerella anatipestifer]MBT0540379.1 tRNA (adenosine(37)-N6)-threonylcarbamoyltransferase complex ATPase subunit type 1 TsaE [Riemerella anatipestifer]MBT0544160.1 tRNA (adenosine(37)-N6)-threonylcarbamoyltransferase complex ATPase subunit type 1 TsaE [Riemerella anatipestifer]M